MKETIKATYKRNSSLPHYCHSAFAKATEIIGMECKHFDFSQEREMGILITDETGTHSPEDIYSVSIITLKGEGHSYKFHTAEEANAQFKHLRKLYPDFERVG